MSLPWLEFAVHRVFLTACLSFLALASCARTPDAEPRSALLTFDAWQSPAAAYNASLDGAGLAFDIQVPDGLQLPDLGPSDVPPDAAPVADGAGAADTLQPDAVAGDVAADSVPDVGPDVPKPTWPEGPLQVLSAFSPDGKGVKVRFNKPVDPASALDPSNFAISGSNSDSIGVAASQVSADPQFVALTLDPNDVKKINAQVTYTVLVKKQKGFDGSVVGSTKNKATIKRTVYLHLLFHQHQPTYLDPVGDVLMSPWVRKHATKDYYDMASVLVGYPDVHLSMNLTAVLLNQLLPYYVDRLGPFVDTKKNTVDAAAFLAKWKGHTDPWIDLLLEPTPDPKAATEKQIGLLYADPWSCVSTAPVLMNRFPAYAALRDKNPATLTQDDLRALKIWFEIAWMDPDFLDGKVTLATGDVLDLTDVLQKHPNGTYTLKVPASEALANRIVAEEYKIMKAVVPIHKQLAYSATKYTGQIELTTTPFYHPILPLVQDTNLMGQGQPFDPKPAQPFQFSADAGAQVGRAVAYFEQLFGEKPRGMWPGEGSVAEEVVQHFVAHGVQWIATDEDVMKNSGKSPGGAPQYPFLVDSDKVSGDGGSTADSLAVYFRNTQMSNDIGFKFQGLSGNDAANELIGNVVAQAPGFGAPDRVITLILDGENAWETFVKEHDGKGFFHALYAKLTQSQAAGEIVTVTGSEYLLGNPKRNVPAHPPEKLPELEPLFPGSWIGGTFSTWIGEGEENIGWGYLLAARKDLQKSGLAAPDPYAPLPADTKSLAYHIWLAYDEIYAAQGSDWFWWYGADMTSPSNDDSPFDKGFRAHLGGMYVHMNAALVIQGKPTMTAPEFKPIIQANPQAPLGPLEPPPTLDGQFAPNEGEWTKTGGFFFDSDTAGAEASPDDWFNTVYYGFGKDAAGKDGLYVGLTHNWDLTAPANAGVAMYLSHKKIVNAATGTAQEDPATTKSRFGDTLTFKGKGASRELWIGLAAGKTKAELRKSDGTANWKGLQPVVFGGALGGPVKNGKLLELFIPYADLGLVGSDPLEMQLVFAKDDKTRDLAPSLEARTLVEDPTAATFVTFACDVSGKSGLAIDTFGPINNPPPPKGKGIVYITGNDPKLGMKAKWVPNKIALRDDGKEGDETAGDNVWSGVFAFPKGASIKYKYTIGLPSNEGQWPGTEEFPLTERGLEVTKDPTKKKVKVADIFADRPQVSGQPGPKTVTKLE